jgi:hypothetical protein
MSKKDEENYKEAEKQEKVSRKLTGPAQVERSEASVMIESLVNSGNRSITERSS